MDLRLVLRVLRRFKLVAALGLILTLGGAFLSYMKVGPHGVEYRSPQLWSSTARVFIAVGTKSEVASGSAGDAVAPVYASLMTSDPVRQLVFSRSRIPGAVTGSITFNNDTQSILPILNITGIATNPTNAAILANDGVWALRAYLRQQQTNLPPSARYRLDSVNEASPFTAAITSPRSKTRPIMVLVLGIAATLALVLILENLRPRPLREVRPDADAKERAA